MATRRTEVPAPEASPTSSAALDELTGVGPVVRHGDVALDLIDPDPRNPEHRSHTLDEDLLASIATLGVLTPVLLRPNPEEAGRWWLIAGHRRVLHARVAGHTQIPATMLPAIDDLGALRRLLTENLHREDLTVVEQAHLVQDFLDLGVDPSALPGELHKSSAWVRSRRAVARLPREVQAMVDGKQLTLTDVERIDEFADDDATYAKLLDAVGGYDFKWKVQAAKQQRYALTRMTELRTFLEHLGVPLVRAGKKVKVGVTHESAGQIGPHRPWSNKTFTEDDAKKAFKAHPDLVAIETKGKYFTLALPVVEKVESPAARRKRLKDETAAAAEATALAEATEQAAIAHRLRLDFIFEILRGERPVSAEQIAGLLRDACWSAFRLREQYPSGYNQMRSWLTAASFVVPGETSDREAWERLSPAAALVAWVASVEEGTADVDALSTRYDGPAYLRGWSPAGGPAPSVQQAWYAHLEALGYVPSSAERDALARPAAAT